MVVQRKVGYLCATVSQSLKHEPWWVEVWSGMTAIAWAFYVGLMPVELVVLPEYWPLRTVSSEYGWAFLAGLIGIAQISAALINVRLVRWAAAMFAMGFWLSLVSALSHSGSGYLPGVTAYGGWAAANIGSILRLLRSAPTPT